MGPPIPPKENINGKAKVSNLQRLNRAKKIKF